MTEINRKIALLVKLVMLLAIVGTVQGQELRINGGAEGGGATCTLANWNQDPATGNLNVTVTDPDDTDCLGGSTSILPPDPTLGISSFSVVQGQSVTVTWSTGNATSCSADGNFSLWSGSKSLGTNQTQLIQTTTSTQPGSYVLELNCSNSAGTGSDTVNLQVNEEGSNNPTCGPDRQPPAGLVRASSCLINSPSTDCTSYNAVFGGFPGTTGIRQIAVDEGEYMAMAFTPTSIPPDARANINLEALQAGSGITGGRLIWSISSCPGDFNVDAITAELDSACVEVGTANFGFGGSSYVSDTQRCALTLDAGSTYYLNVLYTLDDPNVTPSTQLTWACSFFGDPECGHQYQISSPAGWD